MVILQCMPSHSGSHHHRLRWIQFPKFTDVRKFHSNFYIRPPSRLYVLFVFKVPVEQFWPVRLHFTGWRHFCWLNCFTLPVRALYCFRVGPPTWNKGRGEKPTFEYRFDWALLYRYEILTGTATGATDWFVLSLCFRSLEYRNHRPP